MARITIAEMPTVARSGRVSKYAVQMAELEALLGEKNFGAGQACKFEIDKDDLSALVSSLRKAGKGLNRKVTTVFKDGAVYVTDGGVFGAESASATAIKAGAAAKGSK